MNDCEHELIDFNLNIEDLRLNYSPSNSKPNVINLRKLKFENPLSQSNLMSSKTILLNVHHPQQTRLP